MIKNRGAQVIMGAANLLVAVSPMFANQANHVSAMDQKIEKLNATSLKSIESTWLKVANACKARGFNADPVALESGSASSQAQAIYSSFEV